MSVGRQYVGAADVVACRVDLDPYIENEQNMIHVEVENQKDLKFHVVILELDRSPSYMFGYHAISKHVGSQISKFRLLCNN